MQKIKVENIILYEDNDIIALDKPSGLLSIQDGYDPLKQNLRAFLEQRFNKIWVVHRLDKDTSGVIVFAKNASTHKNLNLQFFNRSVRKIYFAISFGNPLWKKKIIDYPLKKDGDRRHRTVIDLINGKKATTIVNVKANRTERCLLEVEIKTGITHQIRSHLAAIGLPIIGDSLYRYYCPIGKPILDNKLILNASSIEFMHPTLNHKILIDSKQKVHL